MPTPYVGFGHDQLEAAPALGDTITCPECGAEHAVTSTQAEGSAGPSLQFYKCGEQSFIAGINVELQPIDYSSDVEFRDALFRGFMEQWDAECPRAAELFEAEILRTFPSAQRAPVSATVH